MNASKASQKIYEFFHDFKVDKRKAGTLKMENVVSTVEVSGENWDKRDLQNVLDHISEYGMNIVKLAAGDVLKEIGMEDKEITSYSRCTEQKMLDDQIDSYFGKKTIGSLSKLFFSDIPTDFQQWKDAVDKACGEAIKIESKRAVKQIISYIEYMIKDDLTKKQKRNCIERIEEAAMLLAKEKSFNGFAFQSSIILFLSKKLKLPYEFGDDGMDSKGIDGTIGGIGISIKPTSHNSATCKKYHTKIPIVYYELSNGNIVINYDELMVMMNNN